VFAAARQIAAVAKPGTVVVTKSTVPVGTGDEIERILEAARPGVEFHVVSNPEFLREGAAISDFKHPDRVVVGTEDPEARALMEDVYRPVYLNRQPVVFMARRTAELTKYAANAFLATKITFINEIADLCEAVGADVKDVARGIGLDNRIGSKFLHAGPGYGGSCFPKDTSALVRTGQDAGVPLRIVEAVVAVNDQRKRTMARKIIAACGGSVRGKTLAVLGLTFKQNTDDMRDAASLTIIPILQDAGATVRAYDPEGIPQAAKTLRGVEFSASAYDCLDGADALVVLTEWDAFRAIDFARVKTMLRSPVVVDLRNLYSEEEMARLGFSYTSVGRRPVRAAKVVTLGLAPDSKSAGNAA
jgi:UDPglucose 6-dehydrogenase